MDKKKETDALNVLVAEYARLRNETLSLENHYDHVLAVAATLAGLLFIYGLQQGRKEVFVLLPALIYGIILYVLYFFNAMCVRGGYLRVIEKEINTLIGSERLIWENHLVPTFLSVGRCPAALGLDIVVLLLALGATTWSHYAVITSLPAPWPSVQLVTTIICVVLIAWAVRATYAASPRAHDLSEDILSGMTQSNVDRSRAKPREPQEVGGKGDAQ